MKNTLLLCGGIFSLGAGWVMGNQAEAQQYPNGPSRYSIAAGGCTSPGACPQTGAYRPSVVQRDSYGIPLGGTPRSYPANYQSNYPASYPTNYQSNYPTSYPASQADCPLGWGGQPANWNSSATPGCPSGDCGVTHQHGNVPQWGTVPTTHRLPQRPYQPTRPVGYQAAKPYGSDYPAHDFRTLPAISRNENPSTPFFP